MGYLNSNVNTSQFVVIFADITYYRSPTACTYLKSSIWKCIRYKIRLSSLNIFSDRCMAIQYNNPLRVFTYTRVYNSHVRYLYLNTYKCVHIYSILQVRLFSVRHSILIFSWYKLWEIFSLDDHGLVTSWLKFYNSNLHLNSKPEPHVRVHYTINS